MSNDPVTWATSEDVIEFIDDSFYAQETVCKAFDVYNQTECFSELEVLLRRTAADGVSIVAVDVASGAVIGVALNKLQDKTDSAFYQEFTKTLKYPASRKLATWIADTKTKFDIFEHCGVTSLFEIMFLGVLPYFKKQHVAKKLVQVSVDIAKQLRAGNNIKVSINNQKLNLGNPPDIVTGIFTSQTNRKIAKDLNFEVGSKMYYDEFLYDGQSLGDLVISKKPYFTYEYLKL
ncbi:uncharacterized protein LOC115876381 isoform X2 [Sitophilus oryzae]|uniref:Uncharacterized protein LOC115876381 isoform X2 n=1 Tax=Sitophilus oryzae TaxID=7048 RepID=A0A6J2X9U0_SITOR|nr:uncharacterized protein LOC115876381 isoform X2 [Sitophilus oryzae]